MNIENARKRKAISPVLATVILIAITLVAGVAIAGFAFGLFGTLSTTENIKVLSAVCSTTHAYVDVANSGGASGSVTGATPSTSFTAITAATTGYAAGIVTVAANTATDNITLTGAFAPGQTITGSLVITGEAAVPFTATCS